MAGGQSTATGGLLTETWSYRAGSWTNISAAAGSLPSTGGVCTYDAHDGYLLEFGGYSQSTGHNPENFTYGFRAGSWSNLTNASRSAPPPSCCQQSMMAYDAADSQVVLLEVPAPPYNGSALTWAYSNGNWTNITRTSGTPPTEPSGGAMAYDAADGYVVEFGGTNLSLNSNATPQQALENGTWMFHGGKWSRTTAPAPTPRVDDAIAYDPNAATLVLFGGYANAAGDGDNTAFVNDTWEFAGGNWTNATRTLGQAAPPSIDQSMVFDVADGYLFLPLVVVGRSIETWILGTPPPFARIEFSPSEIEANERYSVQVVARSEDPPLTYRYTSLAPGCVAANLSQVVCDTPEPGTYVTAVAVIDGSGTLANFTSNVTILPSVAVARLEVTPALLHAGGEFHLTANLTGGIPPYSGSYSGLPPGCPNQNSTSFACTVEIPATYEIRVGTNDSVGLHAFAWANVSVFSLPTITSFSLTATTVDAGTPTTIRANVAGGASPLAFVFSGLPPGCTPPPAGSTLRCTPSEAGEFNLSVTATDGLGASVTSGPLKLTVTPDPSVLALTVSPKTTFVDQSIFVRFEEIGGISPFKINWSGLPLGCAGFGTAFNCTPTSPGYFSVAVNVTDSLEQSARASFSLLVNPAASTPGLSSLEWVGISGIGIGLALSVIVALLRRRSRRYARSTESVQSGP